MCYACQTNYTVKHVLIECTDRDHIRKTFYSANDMKELFQNTEINNVVGWLFGFYGVSTFVGYLTPNSVYTYCYKPAITGTAITGTKRE